MKKIKPLIIEAEAAGICKRCISYNPDVTLLKNRHCLSTRDGIEVGLCTKKNASIELQAQSNLRRKI